MLNTSQLFTPIACRQRRMEWCCWKRGLKCSDVSNIKQRNRYHSFNILPGHILPEIAKSADKLVLPFGANQWHWVINKTFWNISPQTGYTSRSFNVWVFCLCAFFMLLTQLGDKATQEAICLCHSQSHTFYYMLEMYTLLGRKIPCFLMHSWSKLDVTTAYGNTRAWFSSFYHYHYHYWIKFYEGKCTFSTCYLLCYLSCKEDNTFW